MGGLVPPERFLEFDVKKHGWPELTAFLGRPAPRGEPFPNTMSGTLIMQTAMLSLSPTTFRIFLALMLASAVANAVAFRLAWRAWLRWRSGAPGGREAKRE